MLDGSGTAVIAASKSCEVEVTADQTETSSPTSGGWKTFLSRRRQWSVSVSYLLTSPTAGPLRVGSAVRLRLQVAGASVRLEGDALVKNCKEAGARGSLASGAMQFTGNGPLEEVTVG